MNIPNKHALVTGANIGIGLAVTHKLLQEGYHVTGTSRSGKIDQLLHDNLSVIKLDVTDKESIKNAVVTIGNSLKGIDLLINNAGVAPDIRVTEPDMDLLNETFAVNVNGTIFFTESLLTFLNENAQIIFISSAMGLARNVAPNGPAYRMSKAALNVYAIMLSQRLSEKGIRVTPIHPGWVQTRLGGANAHFTTEQAADGIFTAIKANTESGKFWNIESGGLEDY